jgi:hypothetical protein
MGKNNLQELIFREAKRKVKVKVQVKVRDKPAIWFRAIAIPVAR